MTIHNYKIIIEFIVEVASHTALLQINKKKLTYRYTTTTEKIASEQVSKKPKQHEFMRTFHKLEGILPTPYPPPVKPSHFPTTPI